MDIISAEFKCMYAPNLSFIVELLISEFCTLYTIFK